VADKTAANQGTPKPGPAESNVTASQEALAPAAELGVFSNSKAFRTAEKALKRAEERVSTLKRQCAESKSAGLVIVSRDSDYGVDYDGKHTRTERCYFTYKIRTLTIVRD
jgi:hypothetical protein